METSRLLSVVDFSLRRNDAEDKLEGTRGRIRVMGME